MYTIVLIIHSWLRWAALVAGTMAVAAALASPSEVGRDGRADRWGLAFMMAMDLQMLLGLLLYLVLSPNTAAMFNDGGLLYLVLFVAAAAVSVGMFLKAKPLEHMEK